MRPRMVCAGAKVVARLKGLYFEHFFRSFGSGDLGTIVVRGAVMRVFVLDEGPRAALVLLNEVGPFHEATLFDFLDRRGRLVMVRRRGLDQSHRLHAVLHRHSVRLVLARPLEWDPFQSDLLVLCFARGTGGTLLVGG